MTTATTIPITVNGESAEVPLGLALPDLLRHIDVDPEQSGIAVAVNGAVARRDDWPGMPVEEGDEVEVITATQGG
jgi:sulfur carrier protein